MTWHYGEREVYTNIRWKMNSTWQIGATSIHKHNHRVYVCARALTHAKRRLKRFWLFVSFAHKAEWKCCMLFSTLSVFWVWVKLHSFRKRRRFVRFGCDTRYDIASYTTLNCWMYSISSHTVAFLLFSPATYKRKIICHTNRTYTQRTG